MLKKWKNCEPAELKASFESMRTSKRPFESVIKFNNSQASLRSAIFWHLHKWAQWLSIGGQKKKNSFASQVFIDFSFSRYFALEYRMG